MTIAETKAAEAAEIVGSPERALEIERHLAAVTLGRFPRFWLFAVLGDALDIPTLVIWGFLALMVLVGVGLLIWRWKVTD